MRKITMLVPITVALIAFGLVPAASAQQETARVELRNRDGHNIGRAILEQTPHGVLITADLENLPAGTHALHIHETGRCEPPFASAGGHFNPLGREHGFRDPAGPHAGDLPNFYVPDSGTARLDVFTPHVTLGGAMNGLLDSDGSALVIHAGADDYRTDPAGDAGPRIACGVIEG